jgi:hypothetical protein
MVGVSLVVIAVMIAGMIRLERVQRRRIQRRRDAWKAVGGVGTCPGDHSSLDGIGYTDWVAPDQVADH